jgi:argininosuccinate lyase
MKTIKKIYGGIYTSETMKQADEFIVDIQQQKAESELAPFYLWETLAHNYMLAKQKIIPEKESKLILQVLVKYLEKADKEGFVLDPTVGDIHENVETLLTQQLGSIAGWMHIARSRNDQITCDQKLITKKLLFDLFNSLFALSQVLGEKASTYKHVVMPGLTHLRVAMPSSFGFWWQSYLEQIIECQIILQSIYEATDKNPLGAGASYGTNWPIDPQMTTKYLGFNNVFTNALSAINSRGIHELYTIAPLCSLLTILSRMMEDVIIFSMPEINWINMDEGFTSGSSIMPQKMNADVAEKIRGKTAKVLGLFVTTCVAMKGTPSGYNKDSAETKLAILDSLKEVISTVKIATVMLEKITPNSEVMKKSISQSLATKLADTLVKTYKIPFRSAHHIVGKALALAKKDTSKVTPEILGDAIEEILGVKINISAIFIKSVLDKEHALESYLYLGTPSPSLVTKVNKKLLKKAKKINTWVKFQEDISLKAKGNLIKDVKAYIKGESL